MRGGVRGSSNRANTRVYVGNLSWDVSWQDLKDHMRSVGNVVHADVLQYRDGRSSGGGIVQYSTVAEANRAIKELTDTELNERPIFVREDRETDDGRNAGGRNVGGSEVAVFVGNLNWDTSWQTLKDEFSNFNCTHADVGEEDSDGRSRGYGIVKFTSATDATRAIRAKDGSEIDGRQVEVRLDRRSSGTPSGTSGNVTRSGQASVFVGNLPWGTSWQTLKDEFSEFGVLHADVGEERDGRSRGYGIIKFGTHAEAKRAILEMDGAEIDGRNIVVKMDEGSGRYSQVGHIESNGEASVFVGNLSWDTSWQTLKDAMQCTHADVGESIDGRMRGFGIVKYSSRHEAMRAIQKMNGAEIDGRRVIVRLDNKE